MIRPESVADPAFFNLLTWLPKHQHVSAMDWMLLALAIIYLVSREILKTLRPRLIWFELARSRGAALRIRGIWGSEGISRARIAVLIDLLLLPVFAALTGYLCFWGAISLPPEVPWLAWSGVTLGWAALLAVAGGWIEDLALLETLVLGRATKSVSIAFFCARLKYGILAISAAFLLFRFEYFVYQKLEPAVRLHPRYTLAVLTVMTLLAGMRMLHLANPLHPSLLMLHLARSREAANRVLNRWGKRLKPIAVRANRADVVFAILYAETLAFLSFRLGLRFREMPVLASLSQSVGWYMLLAGTCHVAQNCGAEAALYEGKMGWWLHICRACGGLRALLLFLGGMWGGFLWLRLESGVVAGALRSIQAAAGAGR